MSPRPIRPGASLATTVGVLAVLSCLAGCGSGGSSAPAAAGSGGGSAAASAIAGVVFERTNDRGHTTGNVDYANHPPSGGNHDPTWQNCGIYRTPVRDENAVHDLEHGAVWIAYRPGLAPTEVATLEGQARGHAKVLVSPYPGITKPVVLVSWEHRLELDSATDARVGQFIAKYEGASTAPESQVTCSVGGIGTPVG